MEKARAGGEGACARAGGRRGLNTPKPHTHHAPGLPPPDGRGQGARSPQPCPFQPGSQEIKRGGGGRASV